MRSTDYPTSGAQSRAEPLVGERLTAREGAWANLSPPEANRSPRGRVDIYKNTKKKIQIQILIIQNTEDLLYIQLEYKKVTVISPRSGENVGHFGRAAPKIWVLLV